MDSKKNLKEEVELALKTLYKKIDSLKERVDQLCETTSNCAAPEAKKTKKDDS